MLTVKNDSNILGLTSKAERKRKFEAATNKVFERWHDVFVELAKSTDDKNENYEKVNDGSKKSK
jgi:hypothetical protein